MDRMLRRVAMPLARRGTAFRGAPAAQRAGLSQNSKPAVPRKPTGPQASTTPTTVTTGPMSSMLRGSPLFNRSPLARFFDDFEREFADPFFSPVARPFTAVSDITMSLDIAETDKQYVIKADLPGVKKEDVKLSFKDHVLSIMAERREERSSEDETKHFSDFTYGKIVRHLRVPETADKDSIDASMENGVLTVRINKSEQAEQETTIQIK